jgi:hypothetical protein
MFRDVFGVRTVFESDQALQYRHNEGIWRKLVFFYEKTISRYIEHMTRR